MDVSVYWPLCVLFVFVCVFMISNQSISKKPCCVVNLCKLETLLYKTHNKLFLILRYQDLTCVDQGISYSQHFWVKCSFPNLADGRTSQLMFPKYLIENTQNVKIRPCSNEPVPYDSAIKIRIWSRILGYSTACIPSAIRNAL